MNDSAGFDVSSPSYHKNGFAKLKSELLDEMKAYKKYNNLTKSETQQVDDIIKQTKQAKGQLPSKVVRTGFSPGPTKDYTDKNFCDENYSGPGLFDDPDDTQPVSQVEDESCQCRSYIHYTSSCPTPGQTCHSVDCLSEDNYVFECICHPPTDIDEFNSHQEDTYHMKTTDPAYVVQMHNCLTPI